MGEQAEESAPSEVEQGPTGDVRVLEAAISARLGTPDMPVRVVRVSESTLIRDFDAQGIGEFEGAEGPTAGRDADPRAVKAWLTRVCRAHGLSCTYEAPRQSYAFRRVGAGRKPQGL